MSTARFGDPGIRRARCTAHLEREAAAVCSRCRLPWCRECVTEHDQALYCRRCLPEIAGVLESGSGIKRIAAGVGLLAAALVLLTAFAALQLHLVSTTAFHGMFSGFHAK